jgi:peptidoglycan biosynthesis protein MviN/MurJ (putative lipid II flippase)
MQPLLLERGLFLPTDSETAVDVRCCALGLVGYSPARIVSPVFSALAAQPRDGRRQHPRDRRDPRVSVALVRATEFAGLALGTSIAAIANAVLLIWQQRRALGGIDARGWRAPSPARARRAS